MDLWLFSLLFSQYVDYFVCWFVAIFPLIDLLMNWHLFSLFSLYSVLTSSVWIMSDHVHSLLRRWTGLCLFNDHHLDLSSLTCLITWFMIDLLQKFTTGGCYCPSHHYSTSACVWVWFFVCFKYTKTKSDIPYITADCHRHCLDWSSTFQPRFMIKINLTWSLRKYLQELWLVECCCAAQLGSWQQQCKKNRTL